MRWWQRFGEGVLDVLFPPTRLEMTVRRASYDDLVAHASFAHVPTVENAIAIFQYRDPLIRQAIWELKYRGNQRVAGLFAEALADYLLGELADEAPFSQGTPTVVPIPLSSTRLRERGWNQVELVAAALLKLLPKDTVRYNPKLLERVKNTESQTKTRSKAEREKNLESAFSLYRGGQMPNGPIILLDDVITTGATLREARSALLQAGAQEVQCVGLAH